MDSRAKRRLERRNFLWRNLRRGILYLVILVAAFVILKKYFNVDYAELLKPTYDQPLLVYLVFGISEVAFGIIPPEIFFIWASSANPLDTYVGHVAMLSVISFLSGANGFFIGKRLGNSNFYRSIEKRFLSRYRPLIRVYGTFMVIVAAITPIPFSGISMLVGTVGFGWRKYLWAAQARFLRFAVYAFIIWEANQI